MKLKDSDLLRKYRKSIMNVEGPHYLGVRLVQKRYNGITDSYFIAFQSSIIQQVSEVNRVSNMTNHHVLIWFKHCTARHS